MAKPLLASFFFSLLFCAHPPAFAQNKSQSQQTNSPEVSKEIVEKLNENIFKYAIIGVVNKGTESDLEILSAPYQKIYISKGFTLEHYKDCNLTLRNDKGLIVDSFLEDNPNYESTHSFFYTAQIQKSSLSFELVIPLNELSYKKGRKSYRITTKPEKAAMYVTWRDQLKAKWGLPIVLKAPRNGEEESIKGEVLTFTFDDECLSREFDTSFRSAIKFCQSYKPPKADKPNPWIWKN